MILGLVFRFISPNSIPKRNLPSGVWQQKYGETLNEMMSDFQALHGRELEESDVAAMSPEAHRTWHQYQALVVQLKTWESRAPKSHQYPPPPPPTLAWGRGRGQTKQCRH